MIVESITVWGLNGDTREPFSLNFYPDMNILTGKNGSGKTTILKLMWYLMSGNVEYAISEIPFNKVRLITSEYTLTTIAKNRTVDSYDIVWTNGEKVSKNASKSEETDFDFFEEEVDLAQDLNGQLSSIGSSLFFPTFRRIEGGFSLRSRIHPPGPHSRIGVQNRARGGLEEAMTELSRKMSNRAHAFIAAISTLDVVELLMRQYTDMSERMNSEQQSVSAKIIDEILKYKLAATLDGPDGSEVEANAVINQIKGLIDDLEKRRVFIFEPLEAVRVLVTQFFQHSGIELNQRLSFGDAANAVNSGLLSAGEKQMLSFICYNAFYQNSVVFIDEPELSLHVDWQRKLFPTLTSQGKANQFIIATHSPFIYSKYPENEIALSTDKGA
jgi:predicted ATPase